MIKKPGGDWRAYILEKEVKVKRGWTSIVNLELTEVAFYNSKGRLVKTVKLKVEGETAK